ncbi:unnamed protein product, partial [Oncorhynchus mykiss]
HSLLFSFTLSLHFSHSLLFSLPLSLLFSLPLSLLFSLPLSLHFFPPHFPPFLPPPFPPFLPPSISPSPSLLFSLSTSPSISPSISPRCVRGVCDVQSYRCECEEGWHATLCNQQGELTALVVPAVPEGPTKPCSVLLCQHGHCQLTEGGVTYCLCDTGYTGDTCDTVESACRGEAVRDFHRVPRGHANCQTTRPFSWVECRGGCQGGGAACCAPLRVRRRRYTFECDDGSSFTQDVEKAVECGCKECV